MAGENSNAARDDGQDDKSSRIRSTMAFPYTSLEDAEKVAKGVRDLGVTACDWDQLAAQLKFAASGGGFRIQMISAKVFGLLTYERGRVELTAIGSKIVDPATARAARIESFLSVPLFKAAFDKLKGQVLPPPAAIESLLATLGAAPKQKDKARQVFMRSAKLAGFMEIAADRLAIPPNANSPEVTPEPGERGEEDQVKAKPKVNGSGGNGDQPEMHFFVRGLLEKLPTPETEWPTSGRVKWLQTAAHIFDLIYVNNDGDKAIEVKVKKEDPS